MIGVHFCCHTNSTKFTDCCDTAICDDQIKCPRCEKQVIKPEYRWDMAMNRFYGHAKVQKMRQEARRKYP